ncbi:MAG: phytochelatin synthase family protein, partial [Myxococcota bacterium]
WFYWTLSNPGRMKPRPLPAHAVDVNSTRGQKLLSVAHKADHPAIAKNFQVQEKGSWCGVASAVAVLNARGASLSQDSFFSEKAMAVRSW